MDTTVILTNTQQTRFDMVSPIARNVGTTAPQQPATVYPKGNEREIPSRGRQPHKPTTRSTRSYPPISPDGQYLVSYAAGLFVYEFATGKLVRHFNYPASTFAFLGSGIIAVVDEDNRTIRLHRLRDDSEAGRIVIGERFGAVTSLAASADTSRVFVGTERGVVLVFGNGI